MTYTKRQCRTLSGVFAAQRTPVIYQGQSGTVVAQRSREGTVCVLFHTGRVEWVSAGDVGPGRKGVAVETRVGYRRLL